MRAVGLVILLVGLGLVASVWGALYGVGVIALGFVVLIVDRQLKRRELTKPGAARFRPVYAPGTRPAARRPIKRPTVPTKAKARRTPAASQREREPALESLFEPIFAGEESAALFTDVRAQVSSSAKASLTALRDAGYVIRARADRVSVSRNNHTDVLRSNAAIVDYAEQLGLSAE